MAINKLAIENAKIRFKNFSGRDDGENPTNRREFVLVLDADTAQQLIDEGWNVKVREPREEGDEPDYSIKVCVKFGNYPPTMYLVTSRGTTLLNEDTVGQLDSAYITNCDLIVTPYHWSYHGKEGIKAYLKTGYFTIEEDEFAHKYNLG